MNLEKKNLVKKIVSNIFDYDYENVFEPRNFTENLENSSSGSSDVQPAETLRRQYKTTPLVLAPKYTGDFLEKLRSQALVGKPMEASNSNPENLWDFSMPSEMSKHQESPSPRVILDDFYSINGPGPSDQGDGNQTLNDYWNSRGWDPWDAPEMSEDKIQRMQNYDEMKKRVASAFLTKTNSGPDPKDVVASFLMDYMPVELLLDTSSVKTAKLIADLKRSLITTNKGTRPPGNATVGEGFVTVPGVTARLARANPRVGRWSFLTTSGRDVYKTIFQFVPYKNVRETTKLHVRTSCTCPSWLFWGAQYNAIMGEYLYGRIRPKFAPPAKRDPKGQFLVCKHVLACLSLVSGYKLGDIAKKDKERLKKIPKFQIEKNIKEEKLKIPPDLLDVGNRPHIKEIVDNWDEMPRKRRGWVMKMKDPDEVAFLGHRFPSSSTALVAQKLKQMAKIPALKKEAEELLEEVKDIKTYDVHKTDMPNALKNFDSDTLLQDTLSGLGGDSVEAKKNLASEQTDPNKLAYMAYKMRNDHDFLTSILEKLDEIAKDTSSQMENSRNAAKRWLREII